MWVSTFHSTCVRILRNQASLLPGLNSNFSIYDADDSRRLLLMIGKDMGLDTKRYSPRLLANGISNLKNELIGPEQAAAEASEAEEDLARIIAEVYGEYQRRLRAANALDFDDLIGETVAVLQAFPQIAQYYRRRFRHILVDEYQDTNHAQYVLVRELVGTRNDESTVSRPPSCAWSATPTSPSTRSAARPSATSRTSNATSPTPQRFCSSRTTARRRTSCRRPTPSSSRNSGPAREAAVDRRGRGRAHRRLRRRQRARRGAVRRRGDRRAGRPRARSPTTTSRCSTAPTTRRARLEEVFIRAGIPYKVVGGVRFYERREIRDIVAYLRVLDNPGDAVSMRRILNTPRRGIGDRAEACVAVYAENTGASFNDALQAAADGKVPMLNTRVGEVHRRFRRDARRAAGPSRRRAGRAGRGGARPHRIPRRAGVVQRPAGSGPAGQPERIGQRRTRIQHRPGQRRGAGRADLDDEDVPDTGVLAQFLERVSLVADADELPEHGAGVVTMMTLHTAKGLEFPVVFVTGWEDGMFPHMRALGDPTELSEERRLAYVGITRARQRLYLSRAKVRSSWGQPMLNPESRFLREIPQELIDWRRTDPAPSLSAPVSGAGRFGTPRPSPRTGRGGQAPAARAGAGRPGHPRQVRPRPRRRGVRRRRIGDVAHRLRQRRPGQADAQPRAGEQAVSRPLHSAPKSTVLATSSRTFSAKREFGRRSGTRPSAPWPAAARARS